jgi:uncharacterized membrane protein YdfJ with MMPL/SSD domain
MKKIAIASMVLLAGLTLSACSSDSPSKSGSGDKASSSKVSSKKPEFLKVGQSATVDKVTYTLTGVATTTERNQFDDSKPANVIKVTYTLKNDSDKEVPVGTDLEVYGPDGKKLKSYANDNTMDSVAAGKSIDATAHFGTEKLGDFELQFAPFLSFEKAAKFKVNVAK